MDNNNISLMREICSPNVSKIIRLYWDPLKTIPACDFEVTCHGNGIYEFNNYTAHGAVTANNLLSMMRNNFDRYRDHIYNVDVTGIKSNENNGVGSTRFCTMDPTFATYLTNIIKGRSVLDIIEDENGNWMEMLNVSQYFRFMRYNAGGEHFPHWDSDFHYKYNDTYTKYSIVTYFTHCDSGEFAFVNPNGTDFEGSRADWSRQANENEIYLKIKPAPLKILAFPHHLCHTVLPFTDQGNERIIARGDILFRNINR